MGKQSRSRSKRKKPKRRKIVGFNETLKMVTELAPIPVITTAGIKLLEATKR